MASRRTVRAAALTAAGLAATALTGVAASGPSAVAATDATPGYSLRHIKVDTKVGPANDVDVRGGRGPLRPGRRDLGEPQARDPQHQRLRRQQGRQQRVGDRPRLRQAGLHRADLHRPRLPRLRLQGPPRRPAVRRQGRQADGRRARGHEELPRGRRHPQAEGGLPGVRRRPAGRHDRRLLRRPDPVRRGAAGPARGRPGPDHHLERPVLLAGAEQHELHPRRHLRDPRRRQARVGRPVLHGRLRGRRAGHHGRPDAQPAAVPELRRRGLRRGRRAEHRRRPQRGDDRAGPARVGRDVHEQDQGAHAARAGPAGHAVQPAGVRRDVPRAARPGHADPDGLAVVGPLRQHAGAGRARLRRGLAARLVPGQPVPELDEPLRQGRQHRPGRPALHLLPRLGRLRQASRVRRHRGREGLQQPRQLLRRPDGLALLQRLGRPGEGEVGGHDGFGDLRQRPR